MIVIKHYLLIMTMFLLFGCIEPNTEDLWSITIDGILGTTGFARDVSIENEIGYIASGQSGIQIWNLSNQTQIESYFGYTEVQTFLEFDDLSLIGRDTINNLIFASETNKDVRIFEYTLGDSNLKYLNTIMSAKTKDFISFSSDSGQFVMYSADNDDGLKWSIYEPYEVFGQLYWDPVYPPIAADAELYTPGKPLGIDSDGQTKIAMAVDQLGVELYKIDSLGAYSEFVGRVDTEGNAEQVVIVESGIYAACDNSGAIFIPWSDFHDADNITSNESLKIRFAVDQTVDQISVHNGVAILSLGSKGIAIYDVTDPFSPKEKGIFPIGYVYKTEFWGEKLLVCSREGLQIITIDK